MTHKLQLVIIGDVENNFLYYLNIMFEFDAIRKMMSGCVVLILFFGIGLRSTCAEEKLMKIALGDWCPYSCNPETEDGKIGYIAEILLTVFQKAGFKIETKLMPFARILAEVRKGEYTVVPGMFKKNAPDFIFPEEPIGASAYHFFVIKGATWRYQGFESLTKLKSLGLIQNYSYEVLDPDIARFLKEYPSKNHYISGEQPLERNINKLLKGRVDTIIGDKRVTQYILQKLTLSDQVVEAGKIGADHPVYVGFSPAIPQSTEYAQMLVEGIKELKKTGELCEILSRYGIECKGNQPTRP